MSSKVGLPLVSSRVVLRAAAILARYRAWVSSNPFSLNAPKVPTKVSPAPTVLTIFRLGEEAKSNGGIITLFPLLQSTHPSSPRVTTTALFLPPRELDILLHAWMPSSINVSEIGRAHV